MSPKRVFENFIILPFDSTKKGLKPNVSSLFLLVKINELKLNTPEKLLAAVNVLYDYSIRR